ncbi:MAG: TetR family transcriptional regulator [Deltaproteobacteria bacterium]|nr:TetR family transcriptional regulator [Deltaproteobacteria bacterium]
MALRAEKKHTTRQALIRAAHDLFLAQGYDGVTVDRIAEVAGVSKRTFFRYFPSKLDVAFPHHEERLRHFEGLLARHLDPEDPLRGVARAVAAYVGFYQEAREDLLAEYAYVATSRELRARDADLDWQFETAITAALERVGTPPRRARILGGLVFGACRGLLFDWFSGGCRGDLHRLARELLDLLEDLARSRDPQAVGGPAAGARGPARRGRAPRTGGRDA